KESYIKSVLAKAAYAKPYSFSNDYEQNSSENTRKIYGTHTARYLNEEFNISSAVAGGESKPESKHLDLQTIQKSDVDLNKQIERNFVMSLSADKKEALDKSEVKTKEFVDGLDEVALERTKSQERQLLI